MVTVNQVKNGLVKYIDNEVLPHLTGAKKIGLGVYTALAAENLEKTVLKYRTHPAVEMLDVIDENCEINIDRLYRAAVPYFEGGEKHALEIPLIGEIIVCRKDLDELFRLINR